MKRFLTVTAAFGLVLSFSGVAAAHGSEHKTLMGTIHAVAKTEIVVIMADGVHVPVALSPSTRYVTIRNKKGAWSDLQEGMRVVIRLDDQGRAADELRYRPEDKSALGGGSDYE